MSKRKMVELEMVYLDRKRNELAKKLQKLDHAEEDSDRASNEEADDSEEDLILDDSLSEGDTRNTGMWKVQ